MSRALFVIGGFGLGNSTRCAALIEKLQSQGVAIDVATSSNGLWYYSGSPHIRNLISIEPLAYRHSGGRISFLKTFFDFPRLAWSLVSNAIRLVRLQKQNRYSFIATDSEYSAFLARLFLFVPLVSINNVFFTFSGSSKTKSLGFRTWPALAVEYSDYLVQRFLSDFRIAPVLAFEKNLSENGTLFCPPLVRNGFHSCVPPEKLSRALVIASGSELGVSQKTVDHLAKCEDVLEVRVVGLEGESKGKVTYLGRQKDISAYVADSDFIVSNGGFSTISVAIVSSRPILLIPIENHFEQIQNAQIMEALGLGVVTTDEAIQRDLQRLSKSVKTYDSSDSRFDGAEIAASALSTIGTQNEFSFTH